VWDTANDAIIAEGKRVLIDYPARFDGVTVLGVGSGVAVTVTTDGEDEGEALLVAADAADDDEECDT